jgi:hypothetical protein
MHLFALARDVEQARDALATMYKVQYLLPEPKARRYTTARIICIVPGAVRGPCR